MISQRGTCKSSLTRNQSHGRSFCGHKRPDLKETLSFMVPNDLSPLLAPSESVGKKKGTTAETPKGQVGGQDTEMKPCELRSQNHDIQTCTVLGPTSPEAGLGLSCRFEFRSLYHDEFSTKVAGWPQSAWFPLTSAQAAQALAAYYSRNYFSCRIKSKLSTQDRTLER